jgi:hypothetical protein
MNKKATRKIIVQKMYQIWMIAAAVYIVYFIIVIVSMVK